MNKLILVASVLLLSISSAICQKKDKYLSKELIPLDRTVKIGKLDNGFTYFLKKNENPPRQVVMKLVVRGGSFHEEESQMAYAHLIEHVALFHTEKYPNAFSFLKDFGIVSNAYTQETSTSYWLKISNANDDLVNLGLNALKDKTRSMSMDPEKIDIQRGSLLGEMRRNNPYLEWLDNSIENVLYKNINYSNYEDHQEKSNVKNFNLKAFKKFYNKWYRPDRQAIIIVGDINTDSVERKIQEVFSDLKNPSQKIAEEKFLKKFEVNLSGNNQYVSFSDSIDKSQRLIILKKMENYGYEVNSDYGYHKMILQNLYNNILEKRGEDLLKQYDPPIVNYFSKAMAREQIIVNSMNVEFGNDEKNIEEKVLKAMRVFNTINSNFSELEINAAKEELFNEYLNLPFDSYQWTLRLKDNLIHNEAVLTPQKIPEILQIIEDITSEDLQAYSEKVGNLSENTDYVFINVQRLFLPDKKDMENAIYQIEKGSLSEYRAPLKNIDSLENSLPPVQAKEPFQIKTDNILGLTTLTLEGGIKVVLKPISPTQEELKDQVEIHAFRPLKKYKNDQEGKIQTLAHSYPVYTGAGKYNYFEIEKFKRDKGMRMHFYSDKQEHIINASFKNENLGDFFNLLLLYAKRPEEDLKAYEFWKKNKIERLSDSYVRTSGNFFDDDIAKNQNPNIPHVTKTNVQNIDFETLLDAYKNQYSSFNGYTFIITGDFETDKILPEIITYLGALPNNQGIFQSQNIEKEIIVEDINDTIFYNNFNQVLVRMYLPVKVSNDIKSRIMLDFIGQALYERIFEKLRAGCYAPGAGGEWMDFKNEIYAFSISFDSELGNEKNMLRYTNEVIDELKKNGVDEEWLKLQVRSRSQSYYQRLKLMGFQNYWPVYLKNAMERNENPEDFILQYGAIAENFIEVEELNDLIKRLFTKAKKQIYIGLPEDYVDKSNSM